MSLVDRQAGPCMAMVHGWVHGPMMVGYVLGMRIGEVGPGHWGSPGLLMTR